MVTGTVACYFYEEKKMKKKFAAVCSWIFPLCLVFFAACTQNNDDPYRGGKINVAALNGPTMMGLGRLYRIANGETDSKYTFVKETAPDAIIAGLANKTFDAACLPANNAAIIYNTGNIDVKVAVINTLNVLYALQKNGTPALTGLGDLSGKTVHLSGQGGTPEFAFRYLLAKNNITGVNPEFEAEGVTIAAGMKIAGSKYNYAVLPQPAATVATTGQGAAIEAFNLADDWKKTNPDSDIVTAVLVVRTAYLVNNKAAFDSFLEDYRKSAEFMSAERNIEAAADCVVDMGIIPSAAVARAALPKCGITYIEKTDMKKTLSGFYRALHEQNPDAIGGRLPADSFYYE